MDELKNIHTIAFETVQQRFPLRDEELWWHFPLRPMRMLGLIKFDGRACNGEKFQRVLAMQTTLPLGGGRTVLLCPRPEYHLPIFSSETVFLGKKIIYLVDVMQVFPGGGHDNKWFFDKLLAIRERYSALMHNPRVPEGRMCELYSPAACYATIAPGDAEAALGIHRDYLAAYLDMVADARPVSGERLVKAQQDFERFIDIQINHDSAMRITYRCFGEEKGRRWALSLFYNR